MNKDLEQQAYPWSLKVAGSILVLAVALKNIGIDFTPVMQALTTRIASQIEHKDLEALERRIQELEKKAHEPNN